MDKINNLLKSNFTLMDLGSSFAGSNDILKQFAPALTIIEIDAISPGQHIKDDFHKRIKLQKAVSGQSGKRTFYERDFFSVPHF